MVLDVQDGVHGMSKSILDNHQVTLLPIQEEPVRILNTEPGVCEDEVFVKKTNPHKSKGLKSISTLDIPVMPRTPKIMKKTFCESVDNVGTYHPQEALIQNELLHTMYSSEIHGSNASLMLSRVLKQDAMLGSYISIPQDEVADALHELGVGDASPDAELSAVTCSVRALLTALLNLTYLVIGIVFGILGPTLLELQTITGMSSTGAASLFTWGGLGRIISSVITSVTFDRYSEVLQLGLSMLLCAVTTIVIPWCKTYAVLSLTMVLQGMAIGCLGCGCTAYCFKLWGARAPLFVQTLGFVVSAGTAAAPLIAEPFLQPAISTVNTTDINHTLIQVPYLDIDLSAEASRQLEHFVSDLLQPVIANRSDNIDLMESLDVSTSVPTSTNLISETPHTPKVVYIYAISGLLVFCTGLLYIPFFIKDRCVIYLKSESNCVPTSSVKESTAGSHKVLTLQILFALFMMFSCGLELTYGGLVMTFVVDYLHWTKAQAAFLTFVFWISLTIGRGIGVLTVQLLHPQTILTFNMTLTLLTMITLAVGCNLDPVVLWLCSCMLGLALATSTACNFGLAYQYMPLTGRLTSIFTGCAFVGMMVLPMMTGALFQQFHPMCFIYLQLVVAVLMASCYLLVRIYHLKVITPPARQPLAMEVP